MAQLETDEVKMMAEISDVVEDSELRRRVSRTPNASISIPIASLKSYEGTASPTAIGNIAESTNIFPTLDGAHENDWDKDFDIKHKYLSRSEKLVLCDDPYCSTCPIYLKPSPKPSTKVHPKFNNNHCGDAKGFGRKLIYFVSSYVPGVMNPHAKVVQQWNKILAIYCLVAIFVDPLFLFLFYVKKDDKCIAIDQTMRTSLVLIRSINDLIYLSNILLQFRLAYVCPGSRVLGADDLVDHPKKIALNYLKSYFLLDLFTVLPLPQIIIFSVLPKFMASSGANYYAKNPVRAMMLLQQFSRLFRFLQIVRSTTEFILEQALAKDIKNLLIFMLSGHVVGSCWYHFGLQRVSQCLRDACYNSDINDCSVLHLVRS